MDGWKGIKQSVLSSCQKLGLGRFKSHIYPTSFLSVVVITSALHAEPGPTFPGHRGTCAQAHSLQAWNARHIWQVVWSTVFMYSGSPLITRWNCTGNLLLLVYIKLVKYICNCFWKPTVKLLFMEVGRSSFNTVSADHYTYQPWNFHIEQFYNG